MSALRGFNEAAARGGGKGLHGAGVWVRYYGFNEAAARGGGKARPSAQFPGHSTQLQ